MDGGGTTGEKPTPAPPTICAEQQGNAPRYITP